MATYERRSGSWRVKVVRKGRRASATFPTKVQAEEWARKVESEIIAGHYGLKATRSRTLGQALEKFRLECSPSRRGARWEDLRLASFAARETLLCSRPLASLSEVDFATWRERRLSEVSASTVRREMVLLSGVLAVAARDWGWLGSNPLKGVKKPPEPPARRRGVTHDEVIGIISHAPFEVSCAFLLALETAMRASEILSLTWANVDLKRRVVTLPKTKNGDSRQVPLSSAAVDILGELNSNGHWDEPTPVFTLTGAALDSRFRLARAAAVHACPSIKTLRFHDSRSEGITRLAGKLGDVLTLARVVGHRDLKSLLHYFYTSAEDLAPRLG